MTIYTFNLLVGFEPNGVDVAQASRAKMLRGLGVAAKFVFTTWPTPEKLAYYLSLGHRDEELLFAHLAFTDQQTTVPQKSVGALQMEFQLTCVWMLLKNGKSHSLPICGWKRLDLSSGSLPSKLCPLCRLSFGLEIESSESIMELVNSLQSIFSMVVLSDGPFTIKMGVSLLKNRG